MCHTSFDGIEFDKHCSDQGNIRKRERHCIEDILSVLLRFLFWKFDLSLDLSREYNQFYKLSDMKYNTSYLFHIDLDPMTLLLRPDMDVAKMCLQKMILTQSSSPVPLNILLFRIWRVPGVRRGWG